MKVTFSAILILLAAFSLQAQKVNDSTTPLHLLKPSYEIPYGKPEVKSITEVLDRIYTYLDQTTPMALINKETQAEVTDYSKIDEKTIFKPGDFRMSLLLGLLVSAYKVISFLIMKSPSRINYLSNQTSIIIRALQQLEP